MWIGRLIDYLSDRGVIIPLEWKKEMMRERYRENRSLGMEKRDDKGTILGESSPWNGKKR
ncbi:hypothetical protein [Neobacillus niacini]|uniref:hypothetical protein n=1 Tax=Neobacillus niacini TaxID=86668 RepID=UPI00286C5895|nr:hypothetical protein [Neobacillus niacini]